MASAEWSPDGQRVALQFVSTDNKDRWIALMGLDGELQTVHHVFDEAWTNWRFRTVSWLPGK